MATNKGHPKVQHYVPKFVLKNFRIKHKPQVYVFDKHKEKVFKTSINNVAAEQGFYDFELEGVKLTIEHELNKVESTVAHILKKIIQNESLKDLTIDERYLLSTFIAIQFLRTKQERIKIDDMNRHSVEKLKAMGADPIKIENFKSMNQEDIKRLSVARIINSAKYMPYFYDKMWILFKTIKSVPYYISDNPVTLQNMYDNGPYGNIGLGVRGIEIYFPISKVLSLGIFCRTFEEKLMESYDHLNTIKKLKPELLEDKFEYLKQMIHSLNTGCAMSTVNENVINHNSLQVMYSTRFVYSSSDDFELVRKMLSDDPYFKEGLRVSMS